MPPRKRVPPAVTEPADPESVFDEDEEDAETAPVTTEPEPPAPEVVPEPVVTPTTPGPVRMRDDHTFRARFECAAELSTGVHQDNQQRTYQMAVDAGLAPRGGAFGAARVGFEEDGGRRYAVYEIHVRH